MTLPRHDFVLLFDVHDGNPNGDPDAANMPRMDAETGHGLVSDVALKRRVRDYVGLTREGAPGHEIYVQDGVLLNAQHARAYDAVGLPPAATRQKDADTTRLKAWMCQNFYDVRTFGAVMSTGVHIGHVKGPVQLTFARSIDPIFPQDHLITRTTVTSEEQLERQNGTYRTMGRKVTVPYALYKAYGFVSGKLAERSGFSEDDLALLWEALLGMFDIDRSAGRGFMNTRHLYVFRHDTPFGSAPAFDLLEGIKVTRRTAGSNPARSIADYAITVVPPATPGVELLTLR